VVNQSGEIAVGHSELTGPKKDRRTASSVPDACDPRRA
jgi:hypothetical protein